MDDYTFPTFSGRLSDVRGERAPPLLQKPLRIQRLPEMYARVRLGKQTAIALVSD